nr:hypothetical protein [Salinicola tamaricis]
MGHALSERINDGATINAVSLVAMALLATPHHTIESDLLAHQVALLVRLQQRVPGSAHCRLPTGDAAPGSTRWSRSASFSAAPRRWAS